MTDRFAEPLQQVDRTYVIWRGRKLTYFAGCDYFRLSSHPAVLDATRECLDQYGLNVAASRKTTGNHRVYVKLESALRRFFKADAVVLSSTGYFTNIIAAQGLRGSIDHVLIDARAHGSLRDAAGVLGCSVSDFNHRDLADLQNKMARAKTGQRLALMTDGMFSHDGSIAPIADYRAALPTAALLWVDDAHAAGVFHGGRGTVEAVGRKRTIQTVTFSKALGTYGGAILCDEEIAGRISSRSAAVGGNTPIPLPLACATIKSLTLCNDTLRDKLSANVLLFWNALRIVHPRELSPIVALAPHNPERVRRKLLAAGIYPPLIKYPGGPPKGYFRFAISSEHSAAQINTLAAVLSDFMASLMP